MYRCTTGIKHQDKVIVYFKSTFLSDKKATEQNKILMMRSFILLMNIYTHTHTIYSVKDLKNFIKNMILISLKSYEGSKDILEV